MPPGMALIVTLCGSNYRCLEQIFMVPKRFEPSKFDCSGFCQKSITEWETSGSALFAKVSVLVCWDKRVNPIYCDRQASANRVDQGEMPKKVASDQGLHCLPLSPTVFRHINR